MFRALRTARRAHLLIAAGSAAGITTVGILAVVTDLLDRLRVWAGDVFEAAKGVFVYLQQHPVEKVVVAALLSIIVIQVVVALARR